MDERLQHIDMNGGFANQKGIIEDTDMKRTLDMTVPERIVLSAGYDGDDNEVEEMLDIYGDQPIMPPDVLMVGMHTPPSTLTIDHSETTYSRSQAGDGSDTSHPQFQNIAMLKRQYDDHGDSDSESRVSLEEKASERMAVVGREDDQLIHLDPMSLKQLQRRVRMLENELVDTQRSNNIWKILLLALTIVNPFLFNFFKGKR